MPCDVCFGAGKYLDHADDCTDDLCALNGDQHSCAGQMLPCCCPAGRRRQLPPGLRRVSWLAHPKMQLCHPRQEQMPWRHRHRWHWRPGAGPYLFRHRRWSYLYRIELREARAPDDMALLAALLNEDLYAAF